VARAGGVSGLDDKLVAQRHRCLAMARDRLTTERPLAAGGAGSRARQGVSGASDARGLDQGPASTVETLRFDTMLDAGQRRHNGSCRSFRERPCWPGGLPGGLPSGIFPAVTCRNGRWWPPATRPEGQVQRLPQLWTTPDPRS